MQRKTLAKIVGWLGGAVITLAQSGALRAQRSDYTAVGTSIGGGLLAWAAHLASDTSAGHPDGAKTQ